MAWRGPRLPKKPPINPRDLPPLPAAPNWRNLGGGSATPSQQRNRGIVQTNRVQESYNKSASEWHPAQPSQPSEPVERFVPPPLPPAPPPNRLGYEHYLVEEGDKVAGKGPHVGYGDYELRPVNATYNYPEELDIGYSPSYWEDPRHVAIAYQQLKSLPPGELPPTWMDIKAIEDAYEYLSFANGDTPWVNWKYLHPDDPGRGFLQSIGLPPPEYVLEPQQASEIIASQMAEDPTLRTPENLAKITPEHWYQIQYLDYQKQNQQLIEQNTPFWLRMMSGAMDNPVLAGVAQVAPMAAIPLIGGLLAAPFTGGASLLPALGSAGLMAASGAGLGYSQTVKYPWLSDAIAGASILAPIGLGLGMPTGIGAPAGLLGGLAFGALGGMAYGAITGNRAADALMKAFDFGAEYLIERPIGTAIQGAGALISPEKYGTWDEFLANFGSAYKAGTIAYESGSAYKEITQPIFSRINVNTAENFGGMTKEQPGFIWRAIATNPINILPYANELAIKAGLLRGPENDINDITYLDADATYQLGISPYPIHLTSVGAAAMVEMRRRIAKGEDPQKLFLEYQQYFGVAGLTSDLLGHMILDPLNVWGSISKNTFAAGAKVMGADDLAKVMRMRNVHGVFEGVRQYEWMLRKGEIKPVDTWSAWEKNLTGWNEAAKDFNYNLPSDKQNAVARMLDQAWKRTPDASAIKYVEMASDNLAPLMEPYLRDNNMVGFVDLLLKFADENMTPSRAVSELGVKALGGPEWYALKGLVKDIAPKLKLLVDTYDAATVQRMLLYRLSDALNKKPADILADLGKIDSAEGVGRYFREQLTKLTTDAKIEDSAKTNAKKVLAEVEPGADGTPAKLNAAELISIRDSFTGKDHIASDVGELAAQMAVAFRTRAGEIAASVYKVKPDGKFFLFMNSLKRAQSIALLGFNPSYVVANAVNNVISTMAAIPGWHTSKGNRELFWREFGMSPYRMRQGIGLGGITTGAGDVEIGRGGEEAIRKAANAPNSLVKQVDIALKKAGKYLPATMMSQGLERLQSEIVTYKGTKATMDALWRHGKNYTPMPSELRTRLEAVDPSIPKWLDNIIRDNYNVDSMIKDMMEGEARYSLTDAINVVANNLGIDVKMVDEIINHYDGFDTAIKNASNEGGIKEVFKVLREKVDDYLDDMTIQDAENRLREVATRVSSGGQAEAFRITDELAYMRELYWTIHQDLMVKAHADADQIRSDGGTAADVTRHWINTEAKSARWWNRMSYFEYASYQGIFRGLGLEGQGAKDYLKVITDVRERWSRFYNDRRNLIREHYRMDFDTKEAREAHWKETLRRIDEDYEVAIRETSSLEANQDTEFVRLVQKKYGDAAAIAAKEWRDKMSTFNEKRARMNQVEREKMRAMREAGGKDSEQRLEWKRYLDEEFLPLIRDYHNLDTEATQKLWRVFSEQEAPTVPPTGPVSGTPQERTTAQEAKVEPEVPIYRPKTTEELISALREVAGVTEEQAGAAGALVDGHARYLNMPTEVYIQNRLAGIAQGGHPAADALFKSWDPNGVNEKALVQFIRDNYSGNDVEDVIEENVRWFRDVMSRQNNESAIHGNTKTFISGDPSGICPLVFFNTQCGYCYVINPRQFQEVTAKRLGKTVEETFIGMNPIRQYKWAPYLEQIKTMPEESVRFINSKGGMRMFSYADYYPESVLSVAKTPEELKSLTEIRDKTTKIIDEIVADAGEKGLKLKFITKQEETLQRYHKYKHCNFNVSTDFESENAYAILKRAKRFLVPAESKEILAEHPDWTKKQIREEANRLVDKKIAWMSGFMRTGRSQAFSGFTVKEATELKKKYGERVAVRYVAVNKADYIVARSDPRVDVVTMYHGYTDPNRMEAIHRSNKERLYEAGGIGTEGMKILDSMFEESKAKNISTGKGLDQKMLDDVLGEGKMTLEEFTNLAWKDCCLTGKCGNCPVCCGFAAGEGLNIITRFLDGEHRASIEFDQDRKALIRATKTSNITDITHELGHMFRRDLLPSDMEIAAKWAMGDDADPGIWTREGEEKFAKGFEQFLQEGKGPTPELTKIFQMFRKWLLNIYRGLLGQTKEIELDENIMGVYERMLGSEAKDQALLTEQAIREPMPQPGTRDFDSWFAGSKVVNPDGKPLRVFHGTSADFEKFDVSLTDKYNLYGQGIYFSPSPRMAGEYSLRGANYGAPRTIPAYLSMRNPFTINTREEYIKLNKDAGGASQIPYYLQDLGYDGVIDTMNNGQFVVFDPKQIRSSISDKILGQDALQRYQTDVDNVLRTTRLGTNKDIADVPPPVPTNQKRTVNLEEPPQRDYLYKMLMEIHKDEPSVANANMALLDAHAKEWADMHSDDGYSPLDWYELYIGKVEYKPDISPTSIEEVRNYRTMQTSLERVWYSQLERAVGGLTQEKFSSEQLMGMLKASGVKQEELIWTGLADYLAAHPKVTKTEILEYIKNNKVEVEEILRTDEGIAGRKEEYDRKYAEYEQLSREMQSTEYGSEEFERLRVQMDDLENDLRDLEDVVKYGGETKYKSYNLPGGENYRELLFTLPQKPKYIQLPEGIDRDGRRIIRGSVENTIYQSSHWQEGNVLAHVRFDERIDADGKRVLFIQEIQSDWHEEGRTRGYVDRQAMKLYEEWRTKRPIVDQRIRYIAEAKIGGILPDAENIRIYMNELDVQYGPDGWQFMVEDYVTWRMSRPPDPESLGQVPAAPFAKTWHEMTMRRMLRWAAENGFDRVEFPTGPTAAKIEGHQLKTDVEWIRYFPELDAINYQAKGESDFKTQYMEKGKTLKDYIGYDAAKQLEASPLIGTYKELQTKDIVFGGEKMRWFYDEVLVNDTNKMLKRWGVKVGDTETLTAPRQTEKDLSWMGKLPGGEKDKYDPVHFIDITPEMKQSLMGGIPLFQEEKRIIKGTTEHFPGQTQRLITAFKAKDQSTMIHEFSHIWFEDGSIPMTDRLTLIKWFEQNGVKGFEFDAQGRPVKTNEDVWRAGHELFAKGWERYLTEGRAPIPALQPVFDRFKRWMINIYYSLTSNEHPDMPDLTPEVREVFGRMIGAEMENKSMTEMPMDLVQNMSPSLYTSQVEQEGYSVFARDVVDKLEEALLKAGPIGKSKIPAELQPEVRKYLKMIDGDLATAKAAAMGYGIKIRDNAMLDYTDQRGFDKVANLAFPYQYWYTRNMINWAQRMYDRPAWYANYFRLREFMNSAQAMSTFPTRMKNKATWPAPYLPEWAGDQFYFDPLNNIFPFENFTAGISRYQSNVNADEKAAINILYDMLDNGDATKDEVKVAIQSRSGPLWEQALSKAKEGNKMDLFEMISLAQTPALWIGYLYNILKGQPEKITTLPMTRTGQALQAATEGSENPLAQLGNWFGKALAGPETYIRDKAGLSEFGEWGPYYIDRMLANMVADGSATLDDAQLAMIEKTGPTYEEARRRVMLEMAFKVPGAAPVYAAAHPRSDNPWVNAEDIGSALIFGLYPASILPEGELIQRGLYNEYKLAGERFRAGDGNAYQDFYDDHPEYNARLALYKEPEQRMKNFLVSEIWDRYKALGSLEKDLVEKAFGPDFQETFLDDPTGNYNLVTTETLAAWSKALGGMVPKTEEPIDMGPDIDMSALQSAPPEELAEVDAYRQIRKSLFPNYYALSQRYFGLPEGSARKAFIERFPELKEYFEWNKAYKASHPSVEKYANPVTKTDVQYDLSFVSEIDRTLLRSLYSYYYADRSLSDGAIAELSRIWEMYGSQGNDFQEFVDVIVRSAIAPGQ